VGNSGESEKEELGRLKLRGANGWGGASRTSLWFVTADDDRKGTSIEGPKKKKIA